MKLKIASLAVIVGCLAPAAWPQTSNPQYFTGKFDYWAFGDPSNKLVPPKTASGSVHWSIPNFDGDIQLNFPDSTPPSAGGGNWPLTKAMPVQIVLTGNFKVHTDTPGRSDASLTVSIQFGDLGSGCIPSKKIDNLKDGATVAVSFTATCDVTILDADPIAKRAYVGVNVGMRFDGGYGPYDEQPLAGSINYVMQPVGPPSDLGGDQFDTTFSGSCHAPGSASSSRSPLPRDAVTSSKHLVAIAGDSTLAEGTWTMTCIPGTPGSPCSADYTITSPATGQDWFKITSPLKGTVTSTAPVHVTGDASKLTPAGSPFTAQFTITGNFKSSGKVVRTLFDVLPPCTTASLSFVTVPTVLDASQPVTATVRYDFSNLNVSQGQLSLRIYDTADPNKRLLQGASDFVQIAKGDVSPQKTLTINPNNINIDPKLTSVYLIATLVNPVLSNPLIAQTAAVQLPVRRQNQVTATLVNQNSNGVFVANPFPVYGAQANDPFPQSINDLVVKADYDLFSDKHGTLILTRTHLTAQGNTISNYRDEEPLGSLDVQPGTKQTEYIKVPPFTITNNQFDALSFTVYLQSAEGTIVLARASLLVDRVRITGCKPPNTLTADVDQLVQITCTLFVSENLTGTYMLYPSIAIKRASGTVTTSSPSSFAVSNGTINVPIPIAVPKSISSIVISFALYPPPAAHYDSATSQNYVYANLGKNLTFDSPVVIKGPFGLSLNVTQATKPITTFLTDKGKDIKLAIDTAHQLGNSTQPESSAGRALVTDAAPAAPQTQDFFAVDTLYQFTPPVAADGSFSASLTIQYSTGDLPDDPGFQEKNLQIVSYDPASGTLQPYPTTLDLTNKTATATVNSLSPYYALGAFGPASQRLYGTRADGFTLINFGSSTVAAALAAYSDDGSAAPVQGFQNPSTMTLAPGQQFRSTNALDGWLQVSTINAAVAGAGGATGASSAGSVPLAQPASTGYLLPLLEGDAGRSTTVSIQNLSPFPNQVQVDLHSASGTHLGSQIVDLDPKGRLVQRLDALFPQLPSSFRGYALLFATQRLIASESIAGGTYVAQIGGLALTTTGNGGTLYAPHFETGNGALVTTLSLVNPSTSSATVTLNAHSADGKALGPVVSLSVGAQSILQKEPGALLGLSTSSLTTGSLVIQSNVANLSGTIAFTDPTGASRALIPLETTPATFIGFPNIATDSGLFTSVAIASAGVAANVVVRAFDPTGVGLGTAKYSLEANGRLSGDLTALLSAAAKRHDGYFTVEADQPVVAIAMAGRADLSELSVAPALKVQAPQVRGVPDGTASPGPSNSLNPAAASRNTPQINAGGLLNAASFVPKLARGGLASVFGSNFVAGSNAVQASSLPLPLILGGVSVTVGGIPAPLIFANASQVNFQVPFEVPTGSSAAVVVTANGNASPAAFVQIADYAVGVFTYARTSSATDPIVVHNSTNQLVTPSNPAVPDEALVVYATGVGKLSNPPATGVGSPSSPVATSVDTPTITVGGFPARVLFAGLTPGLIGLVQLNIQLPASLPSGSLPLSIQFPGDSSLVVNLAVKGSASTAVPKIGVAPASLDFGTVNLGQNKDMSLTITNTGATPLSVSSITSNSSQFTPAQTAATVLVGTSVAISVRFAPSAAGPQAGTLTVASNDTANSTVKVPLTGTGAPVSTDTVLQVDGGTFNSTLGFLSGSSTAVFVNRLTPPSYPATLKSVQIYFGDRAKGLPVNTSFTVVEATNPSGSSSISTFTAGVVNLVPAKISAVGSFTSYPVPGVTINSGDFVVGFLVPNPSGIAPADLDQTTTSQKRSYTSSDGFNFTLIDNLAGSAGGNFGIRAVVTLGSGTTASGVSAEPGMKR